MELDWDVFLADFGDSLLEFELRLTELEYDDGEAIVSWELEKVNDQLGGITYVVLVMSPQQTVEYHEPDPRSGDSQTMRVEAEPGDEIDVILYDTLNTDYEPGDGAVGPGAAQVNGVIPDDAGGGGALDRGVLTVDGDRYEVRLDDLEVGESGVVVSIGHEKEDPTAADITVSYEVSVGGSTAATGSFVPPDAFAQDRETIPAVPGDLVTVVLESGGDSVTLSGTVEGDNDGAVGPEPGPIEIVSCDTSDQVEVGESAFVTATVENIGAAEGSATVVIEAGGAESSTDVTLDAGERTTVAVGFEFDDAGEFPASVELR